MKLRFGALLTAGAVALAPRAFASEPPAPTGSSAVKTHGVVISVGIGPGLFIANSSSPPNVRHFNGESVSLSLLLGGHFGRTFSFGGGYLRDEVVDLRAKDSGGGEPNLAHVHFFTSVFGLFGDFRLPTRPELHLQPFLGYGSLFVDRPPLAVAGSIDNPSGLFYAGTLTSEFRVTSELTLGAALRLLYASFSVNETGINSTPVELLIPALMVTGRYD